MRTVITLKMYSSIIYIKFLALVLGSPGEISAMTMQEFFPEIFQRGNLSEIQWDHAVNSKALLSNALANINHMIEADVIMGHHNDDLDMNVIMGHPPAIRSDLSLQEFLQTVVEHNKKPNVHNKKGIKLDFKSNESYARSITNEFLLNEDNRTVKDDLSSFPVWINGDIHRGPGNPASFGIDMQLESVKAKPKFLNAVLWSLGWTTGDYNQEQSLNGYTIEHINEMKDSANGIPNITFPVRAMYVTQSKREMKSLLELGTLTIWSASQDDSHVKVRDLAKLINDHLNKIYVDVPKKLRNRIFDAIREL